MSQKNLDKITDIILILLGLLLVYQLLRKILGGSWQYETIIITLLLFNLGMTWRMGLKLEGHIGWHKGRNSK